MSEQVTIFVSKSEKNISNINYVDKSMDIEPMGEI